MFVHSFVYLLLPLNIKHVLIMCQKQDADCKNNYYGKISK